MIKGTFKITKAVYEKDNFCIYGAIPLEITEGQVQLNQYGNVSLQTNGLTFAQDHVYEFTLEEKQSKYGVTYEVIKTDLDFSSIDEITPDLNYRLLCEIINGKALPKEIHKHYPNFIALVLTDQTEQIDINKVHGLGDKLMSKYVKKIKAKCVSFSLRAIFPELNLSERDCRFLVSIYDDITKVQKALVQNPYMPLMRYCGWSFYTIDRIMKDRYKTSPCRVEMLIYTFIKQHEYEGSTYCNAIELAEEIMQYDSQIVYMLKDISIDSDYIHYEEGLNILQTMQMYRAEKNIAEFLNDKLEQNEVLDWEWDKYTEIKDGTLTTEQQNVLKMFCEHNVLILDAAAGTGKTATTKALLTMLEDYDMSYICLAPTGKASARMMEQTSRSAYTIHRATLTAPLTQQAIIIDESSMLSIETIQMIILALNENPTARLLFIGDSAQIPSIGAGRILKDMLESGKVASCTLTYCFRFKEGGASYVSALSRSGQSYLPSDTTQCITLGDNQDYIYLPWDGSIDQIINGYLQIVKEGTRPEDICLLVPYNKYEYGTININNIIQSQINPIAHNELTMSATIDRQTIKFHKNDMVMNIANNYGAMTWKGFDDMDFDGGDIDDLDNVPTTAIFNGQTGKIVNITKSNMVKGTIAIVDIEGELVVFTEKDMSKLRLAYASTIHKYQGSQSKVVISVTIPPHKRMWNRQLLYTAQTRMQDKLIEIGDINTISMALNNVGDEDRKTRLKEFIIGA